MRQARHWLISGQVQGVSYRYAMRDRAKTLGLAGWCRNLPDGRVEAMAVGLPEALARLIDWSHEGPSQARVDHVEVTEVEIPVEFRVAADTGFEIRR